MNCSSNCSSSRRPTAGWLPPRWWGMVVCMLGLAVSGCWRIVPPCATPAGLTPADLIWRVPYQYGRHRTAYTINVRSDSVILGAWDKAHYLVLDPATGAIRDTLRSLHNPETENFLHLRSRMTFPEERKGVISIPVGGNFMLDSLIETTIFPQWRGCMMRSQLSMRRRSDGRWVTVEIDQRGFGVNDIVPYRDRYLLLQYTAEWEESFGWRYDVGLLDLNRIALWRE